MAIKLLVSADYLVSDAQPRVCLFSGSTEKVQFKPFHVLYSGPRSDWWKPKIFTFGVSYKLRIPVSPWVVLKNRIWSIVGAVSLGFFAVGCILEPFIIFHPRASFSVQILCALIISLLLLSYYFHYLGRVHIRALDHTGSILIQFPDRLFEVYQLNAASYATYLISRSMVTDFPDANEGWEDEVQPGWDLK